MVTSGTEEGGGAGLPPGDPGGRKALSGFFDLMSVADAYRGSGLSTVRTVRVVLRAAPGQVPVLDLDLTAQLSEDDARRLRDELSRLLAGWGHRGQGG